MGVPSRIEAAGLLASLDPPPWFLHHAHAVADIAVWLARAAARQGRSIDHGFVAAAALLHDVDKVLPRTDPAASLVHGEGSAAWLGRMGHPELGAAVAAHPVLRLLDATWFGEWLAAAPLEELIVAYADKRAGQRLESMEARFASWERRYPPAGRDARAPDVLARPEREAREAWDATRRPARDVPPSGGPWSRTTMAEVHARAATLERAVCSAAGVDPAEVRRRRWAAAAMRRAGGLSTEGTRAARRQFEP